MLEAVPLCQKQVVFDMCNMCRVANMSNLKIEVVAYQSMVYFFRMDFCLVINSNNESFIMHSVPWNSSFTVLFN